jgi:hypothetical protein
MLGLAFVVVPTLAHLGEVFTNPYVSPSTTVTEVTTQAGGEPTTKTITKEASRSFVERSLAAGGLLFLRIGVVVLAAFFAGALVQRMILGNYALKVGPVELPELARAAAASAQAVDDITAQLDKQAKATEEAMRVAAGTADGLATLHEKLEPLVELLTAERSSEESKEADVHLRETEGEARD